MRSKLGFYFATGLFTTTCFAQLSPGGNLPRPLTYPPPTTTSIQDRPEPIMMRFKRTVVFLEVDCLISKADGSTELIPYLGTGFLISHRDERYPQLEFRYLVTNRHVAIPGSENQSPCNVVDRKVRFNSASARAGNRPVLSDAYSLNPALAWILPTDPAVDLALIPFGLDTSNSTALTFPTSDFLTDAQVISEGVTEGDSVVFTGLFVQFLGQQRIQPIVRTGKIAMIPDEPIPTTLRRLGSVYLVDTHVFGGNSGSPVLINLAGQRDGGLTVGIRYKLLGLVSGYVQENSEFSLHAVAGYAGTIEANSGIAMVVPAQHILDLVETATARNMRQAAAEQSNGAQR